jgi:D-serine deaminase-like pyridoxal phosphate-dependent protein
MGSAPLRGRPGVTPDETASVPAPPDAPALPDAVTARLPTPCAVVDVAACRRNIARAVSCVEGDTGIRLRPHFKAHKCTALLARQLAAGGCNGVTCATSSEAGVLAERGFGDILVANQVVGGPALAALGRAAQRSAVTVVVDDLEHVRLLSAQARRDGVRFGVLIEIDVGLHRCGLSPGSERVLTIAGAVRGTEELTLRGLQGYEGQAVLLTSRAERREHVWRAAEILAAERDRLLAAAHQCPVISGGGTGTLDLAVEAGVLTEIQAGSYVLMDSHYARLDLPFEQALFILSTVISRPRRETAVIDAGLKAMTTEHGLAMVIGDGLELTRLSDEHGWLNVAGNASPRIGDRLMLVPSHVDPCLNLHDVLFSWAGEASTLEAWPVDGRRTGRGGPGGWAPC